MLFVIFANTSADSECLCLEVFFIAASGDKKENIFTGISGTRRKTRGAVNKTGGAVFIRNRCSPTFAPLLFHTRTFGRRAKKLQQLQ